MSQPQWKLIASTDRTALYVDETGVHPSELAVAVEIDHDEKDIEAVAAVVHRFPIPRLRLAERGEHTYLIDIDPDTIDESDAQHHEVWFADMLDTIASFAGYDITEALVVALCSDDATLRMEAYDAIASYCGAHNFDHEPREWTASEFAAWPERGPRLSTTERDAFTEGYVSCALWCGVLRYEHAEECPCHEASGNGEAYDPDACECEPDLVSADDVDDSQLTDRVRAMLVEDARTFYADNVLDLRASTLDMSQAGHDLWLTRNRHGAGFWDHGRRGDEADAALRRLTGAAHDYGSQDLVEGSDTKVTVM